LDINNKQGCLHEGFSRSSTFFQSIAEDGATRYQDHGLLGV